MAFQKVKGQKNEIKVSFLVVISGIVKVQRGGN